MINKIIKYGTITTATLFTFGLLAFFVSKSDRILPYLGADYNSEIMRVASPRKPVEGMKGFALRNLEHIKTVRDFGLFTLNEIFCDLPEYYVEVSKSEKSADFFLEGDLVKRIDVGTGKVDLPIKRMFGQYVTPVGEYMVIKKFSREDLNIKFGENHLYGSGMLQLSGPWAPYIAIHGTDDPSKIGKNASNGCVNVNNADLEWMLEHVGIGSKVRIF